MVSQLFELEKIIEKQLACLKAKFKLVAVKAEFEAEGASFRDLLRLRRQTSRKKISLYLKVGGVEALRDIKDAFDLGVDGLIAPMVESPFGVVKFISAVDAVFGQKKIFKSINIETRGAIDQIDKILEVARGKIDNITIGRTDLSRSYFDSTIHPDSSFIFDLIENLSLKIHSSGLTLTVGGSITADSIQLFKQRRNRLGNRITSIETRKIILPCDEILGQEAVLKEALYFEELYLRHKLANEAWFSKSDQERLTKIKTRF